MVCVACDFGSAAEAVGARMTIALRRARFFYRRVPPTSEALPLRRSWLAPCRASSPPDGDPRCLREALAHSDRSVRAGPMRLQKRPWSRPHDAEKLPSRLPRGWPHHHCKRGDPMTLQTTTPAGPHIVQTDTRAVTSGAA